MFDFDITENGWVRVWVGEIIDQESLVLDYDPEIDAWSISVFGAGGEGTELNSRFVDAGVAELWTGLVKRVHSWFGSGFPARDFMVALQLIGKIEGASKASQEAL